MKKIVLLIVAICILAPPVAAFDMRGLWIDAWNPGIKSPEETAEMVARARECNFNTLFVQVRKRGNVYYKSAIEPMAPDVQKDYDPLEDALGRGRASGLQVHAWITVYEVYHDTKWNKADAGQVHVKHPEWLMKDESGNTKFQGDRMLLDPGVPEVQDYLVGIITEIARNYDIDGIHLDIVKYPGQEAGYNEKSIGRFNSEKRRSGSPGKTDQEWCNWRRAQVTEFVKKAGQALKRIRKDAVLSASVSPNSTDAYTQRLQDWEGWLRSGILDFAVPMVFQTDGGLFMNAAGRCLAGTTRQHPIYLGIGGWQLSQKQGIEQMELARKVGARGVVVYSYAGCSKPFQNEKVSLMDALRKGPFSPSKADSR